VVEFMNNSLCLGVVLAGGLSSRMGQDKALLPRKGKLTPRNSSMLDFSKKLLSDVGINDIIISGKNHGLADKVHQMGPLGGIYSVIEKYQPKALLILPVDLPLMTQQTLAQLKRIGEVSNKACYFHDNYLPLYLPVNAFVERFFSSHFTQKLITESSNNETMNKGPSIRSLLNQLPSEVIKPNNSLALFNANTPQQWREAQTQFDSPRKSYV